MTFMWLGFHWFDFSDRRRRDISQRRSHHQTAVGLARFTRTHGVWSSEALALEDLLVALADAIWKGQRLEELESQVVAQIAKYTETAPWETFSKLDDVLDPIASRGDERLAWQGRRE